MNMILFINFLKYEEKSYSFNKSLSQNKNHSLLQIAIKIQIQEERTGELFNRMKSKSNCVFKTKKQIKLSQKIVT